MNSSASDRTLYGLLAAAAIVLPLSPLLVFPHADWWNQVWEVTYWREYLLKHLTFPSVINTTDFVGIPQPIFYGTFFYPLVSALSVPLGADWAIRLVVAVVWTTQFFLVQRLIRAMGGCGRVALAVAMMTNWAVYPMTNLYNRGAIAEFFASSLLCSGLCAGMLSLLEEEPRRAKGFALLGTLLAIFAFGSHPPTAAMGGLMAILIAPLALAMARQPQCWRRRLLCMAGLAAWVAVTIAPWLYVVISFSGNLAIQQNSEYWYINQDDSWPARLEPLPLDHGTELPHANYAGTAFLDGQFSYPLLLFAIWSAASLLRSGYAQRDRIWRGLPLLLISLGLFAFTLGVSSSLPIIALVPMGLLRQIQFPFRLVTYQNLSALGVLAAAIWMGQQQSVSPIWRRMDYAVLILAITWAAAGLSLKLSHAMAVRDLASSGDAAQIGPSDQMHEPPPLDYACAEGTKGEPPVSLFFRPTFVRFNISNEQDFRGVTETAFDLTNQAEVVTNMVCFPWNRLIVNGRPLPFDSVIGYQGKVEAFLAGPGHYVTSYRFEPDPVWTSLKVMSGISLIGLLIGIAACFRPRFGNQR